MTLYAIATTALQKHLNECWEIVAEGNPKVDVIRWLRQGGHASIDDEAAKLVADLMEKDTRRLP